MDYMLACMDLSLIKTSVNCIHILHGLEKSKNLSGAVFIIDPDAKIRTILSYPLSIGGNFDELKRIILALQKSDAEGIATPADWRPGDDVISPPAETCEVAKERMESEDEDTYCLDWFMCF